MNNRLIEVIRNAVTSRCLYSSNGNVFYRKGPRGAGTPLKDNIEPAAWLYENGVTSWNDKFDTLSRKDLIEAVEYLEADFKKISLQSEEIGELLQRLVENAEAEGYFRISEIGTVERVEKSTNNYSDRYMDWIRSAIHDYITEQVKAGNAAASKLKADDKIVAVKMNMLLGDRRNLYIKNLQAKYAFIEANNADKRLDTLVERLVLAWTRNKDPETLALDKLAVKQVLWQVKRKFYNLEVSEHLALFIYGQQGCGKSTAVKKFFGFLPDQLVSNTALDSMNDRSLLSRMRASAVCILDEANLGKLNINKLKNFITEESAINRGLYKEATKEYNQTTLVGTTNHQLDEIISDPTGVRRFYSIDVTANTKMHYETINSLPYEDMFLLTDENDDMSPLLRDELLSFKFRRAQHRKHLRKSTVTLMVDELLKLLDFTAEERAAYTANHGYKHLFGLVYSAGLIHTLKNLNYWMPEWEEKQSLVWNAYHGYGRHQGFYRGSGGWDKSKDMSSFQRSFYEALVERFAAPPEEPTGSSETRPRLSVVEF